MGYTIRVIDYLPARRMAVDLWGREEADSVLKRNHVILDLDTGIDDAVALIVALLATDIELLGVTTVSGNCAVKICTENTLRVLDYMAAQIPVFEGMADPLERPYFRDGPSPTHGGYLDLPAARSQKQETHAVDWLISTLLASQEPITLICVAPLTNIATAINREPAILAQIGELIIMGGGHAISNMTPSSEFNIWVDAKAAKMVLRCGRPIRLVTLDATHQARISHADLDRLDGTGSQAGRLVAHLLRPYIDAYRRHQPAALHGTAPLHDPLAVAALLEPEILQTELVPVDVETEGAITYGRTVCDFFGLSQEEPNVHVAVEADGAAFRRLLFDLVQSGP